MTVPRGSVPVERTWGDSSVFATVEAWEVEVEAVRATLPALAAFQGRLGEGAAVLARALAARDELARRAGQVFAYALMGYAVETTDTAAVARFGRAQALEAQLTAARAFVGPEVLAVGRDRLRAWAAEEPALFAYGHYFDDLFRRSEHTRAAEVEEVMGLVSDAFSGPYAAYSALVDTDVVFAPAVSADGKPFEVTQGSIDALLASADRTLRCNAWASYADGYLGVRNALAANLASCVKQAVFTARACAATNHLSPRRSPARIFRRRSSTI